SEIRLANLRAAKPCLPQKNPSMDFSGDRRFALQISALLTRHPWLDIPWQERKKIRSLHSQRSVPQKNSCEKEGFLGASP
ncbi:MAG: hypothetical protein IIT57_08490, partial [Treponema sp.]|nr:hypothetical protein [Treponema sp.]